MKKKFWHNKKVFITGHNGFKGTWLTLWLSSLGAKVIGYSLEPSSESNLFELAKASKECTTYFGDINDFTSLFKIVMDHQPEFVFHLAAQPLVRESYHFPIKTFKTNVLGTVHLLEVSRKCDSIKVIINVTSDKCYENNEQGNDLRESDRLGGHDPYSASKACAELITTSYRKSFFHSAHPKIASARAGNVIGGGDWGKDRLFPDIIRSLINSEKLSIRNPNAIRPWQHVLEPLNGYLTLAENLWQDNSFLGSWNFGPQCNECITVNQMVHLVTNLWGKSQKVEIDHDNQLYESSVLKLDVSKAYKYLGWKPKLSIKESIIWSTNWYKKFYKGENMEFFTKKQIKEFQKL